MRRRRWAWIIFAAVAAGLLQATFFSVLPWPWRAFQPVLPIAVIFVALRRPKPALAFAAIGGYVADLFLPGAPRFIVAEYLIVIWTVIFLSEEVLTNRSVYVTAALVAVARAVTWIWEAGVWAANAVMFNVHAPAGGFSTAVGTLLWDIATVSALFVLLVHFTRRFLITISQGGGYG